MYITGIKVIGKPVGIIVYWQGVKNMGRPCYFFSRTMKIREGRCVFMEGHRKYGKAPKNIIFTWTFCSFCCSQSSWTYKVYVFGCYGKRHTCHRCESRSFSCIKVYWFCCAIAKRLCPRGKHCGFWLDVLPVGSPTHGPLCFGLCRS